MKTWIKVGRIISAEIRGNKFAQLTLIGTETPIKKADKIVDDLSKDWYEVLTVDIIPIERVISLTLKSLN